MAPTSRETPRWAPVSRGSGTTTHSKGTAFHWSRASTTRAPSKTTATYTVGVETATDRSATVKFPAPTPPAVNPGHKRKDVPTLTNVKGSNGYDAVSLAFGDRHACALLDDGDVVCWGRNNAGQLATTGGDKDTPQAINLGTGRTATSIYAGGNHNCAILDDASVKCWGQTTRGSSASATSSIPTRPPPLQRSVPDVPPWRLLPFKTVCASLTTVRSSVGATVQTDNRERWKHHRLGRTACITHQLGLGAYGQSHHGRRATFLCHFG